MLTQYVFLALTFDLCVWLFSICQLHLSRDLVFSRLYPRQIFVRQMHAIIAAFCLNLMYVSFLCCWIRCSEKLRRISLVALEGGKGPQSPFCDKVDSAVCCSFLWPDAEENRPCVCRPRAGSLLQLAVTALPAAQGPADRGMCPGLLAGVAPSRKQAKRSAQRTDVFPFPSCHPRVHVAAWLRAKSGPASRVGHRGSWLCCRTGRALRSLDLTPAPPASAEVALPAQWRARPGVSHLLLALP